MVLEPGRNDIMWVRTNIRGMEWVFGESLGPPQIHLRHLGHTYIIVDGNKEI
jgi:hypothetical protein